MPYKSLLCVVSDYDHGLAALEHAISFASTESAHLEVLCLGIDLTQTTSYYAGANAVILQETITRSVQEAEDLKAKVENRLKTETILWSTAQSVAALADLGRHVAARARFADLVILPHPYGNGVGPEQEVILESCLFEAKAPALVVPNNTGTAIEPKRIVIGWNESSEAMTAIRAALPMLKRAAGVCITVVDPPVHSPNRSDPGGMLSQFLARHGVHSEISVLSKSLPRVSDVIMRHINDSNADLLVMGAYGHSRLREAIFGGATRNMLEEATVPIFLAH